LLAHDTDPFNRWEAGRALARGEILAMVTEGAAPSPQWLEALAGLALDESLDPAFRALALRLPGEDELAQTLHDRGVTPDPDAIHTARRAAGRALATRLAPQLPGLIAALTDRGPFSPDAA